MARFRSWRDRDITVRRGAERILLDESERLKRSVQVGAADLEHAETALHESQAVLLQNREQLRALTASLLRSQGKSAGECPGNCMTT